MLVGAAGEDSTVTAGEAREARREKLVRGLPLGWQAPYRVGIRAERGIWVMIVACMVARGEGFREGTGAVL